MRAATALAVTVAAIAAYAPTIDNYFVQDDFGVVWLLSRQPAGHFPRWFVTSWMDQIWGFTPDEVRPFVAASYQLAAVFGAGWPVPNHLLNIAVHAGVGLLVFAIARHAARCGAAGSAFAALVFVLLPNQAESVAWITGRVDSMPALFYFGAFVSYVRWRSTGRRSVYAASLACYFVALFSKQNTVTLAAALVLYDLVVGRHRIRASWTYLRPYVPYALMTAGYLLLRYELFGEAVRESLLTTDRIGVFLGDGRQHLVRIAVGDEQMGGPGARGLAIAALCGAAARAFGRARAGRPGEEFRAREIIYFAVIWTALGLLPTIVSTYASPRHAYLAAAGWAVALGIVFDALWRATAARTAARAAALAAAAAVVAGYAVHLRTVLADWEMRAGVSARTVAALEREAVGAPEGTLVIMGAPARSWEYALPFAAQPPFTRTDLTDRVAIISESSLHCCPPDQWEPYTRERLREWTTRRVAAPLVILSWDATGGRLLRLSDADDPSLRGIIELLLSVGDPAALDRNLHRLLVDFVGSHGLARDSGR